MSGLNIVKELKKLANRTRKVLAADKIGAGIKLNDDDEIRATDTGGCCVTLGYLSRIGGSLMLYLDRYSGNPDPSAWYGFRLSDRSQLAHVEVSAKLALGDEPIRFDDGDYQDGPDFYHLKRKLPTNKFDRLVAEEYMLSNIYFLGIYCPYTIPFDPDNLVALASEARNFFVEIGRKVMESYTPDDKGSPGSKPRSQANQETARAAVKFIMRHFQKKGYSIEDRQKVFCGYDLLVRKKNHELHIEVKGGTGKDQPVYLEENEERVLHNDPKWRLAVVTQPLVNPRYKLYDRKQFESEFQVKPCRFLCTPKSKL